jgi:hypothetical protein
VRSNKAEAAGAARTTANEHATAVAGVQDDRIKGGVLMLHDFDISPRLGL